MARKFRSDGTVNPYYSTPAAGRRSKHVHVTYSPEALAVLASWPPGTRSERASRAIVAASEKSTDP